VHEHDTIVRCALDDHGGREVKHTGDGIMASFDAPSAAVEAASAIQVALAARNRSAETPIEIRIGISAGEPLADEGDLFGATVQLAARLCAASAPGRITASVAVRELCVGKQLRFDAPTSVELKGFDGPTPCHDVHWS
jgi:class 3 adenylate cyclase